MTIEEQAVEQSAIKKMALIELMLRHGEQLCHGSIKDQFDLTIASPGIVISLYLMAMEHIDGADLCDEVKTRTRRAVQYQVERLLTMVLDVVRSDNPRQALLGQGVTLAEALAMGPTDGEVH